MKIPVSVGSVIGEKYLIERILGSGGMSVVAQGRHLDLEQEVAIKFLSATLDRGECAERFRREARAAARIRSHHVARILDFGVLDDETPFMVMEYLEGNDLSEEFQRRGTLPVEELVDYVLQAIEALAEAHANGIVHRDIKPENLFLAQLPDLSRQIKVLDFGISRSLSGGPNAELSLTKTAAFIGSPLYMSPEQMRAPRLVDHRSDIWSLGVILYEGVSGRLPYIADTIPALCSMVMSESHQPLSAVCSGVSPEYEAVVARCLEKDPARRFENLAELSQALGAFSPNFAARVERVARILEVVARGRGPSRPTLSGISPFPKVEVSRARSSPSRRHSRRERLRPAAAESRLLEGGRPTLSAWGRTDPAPSDQKRRPWLIAASVLGTALLCASMLTRGSVPDVAANDGSALERRYAAEPVAVLESRADVAVRSAPSSRDSTEPLVDSVEPAPKREIDAAPPPAAAAPRPVSPARSVPAAPAVAALPAPTPVQPLPAPTALPVRRIDPWDPSNFGGRQ